MTGQHERANPASPVSVKPDWRNPIYDPKWNGRSTFSVEEAGCEILGLSKCSAYAAAKNGSLPTVRVGRRLIVPRIALERLLGV
jgi:excisionase family DNA binding protein